MIEAPSDPVAEFGLSAPPERRRNPIVLYFKTLKALLTHPTDFFRNLNRPTGIAGPLLFGMVTNWIGSALEYLWFTGFGKAFGNRISDIFHALDKSSEIDSSGQTGRILAMRETILDWMFGVGAVLIDPFKTFLQILFLSAFVWVGARLFGSLSKPDAESRMSYESAVSIVGFSLAASIFKGIPILGGLIAGCFTAAIAIIGASETYRVGTGRAILIALFPAVLFW
ncbi:MAG: YIP1 family protein [Cryobacterium sp.]|nr:YIP1 family protein [Oligoflexia bacterium]